MKKIYLLFALLFTLLSCGKEVSPIEKEITFLPPEENTKPIVFNVKVDDATKASSKKTWTEGDVVYIVFKGITTKYLQLIRDENESDGWRKIGQNTSFTVSDFSGIADADKKLTAVYFPVLTEATLSNGTLSFVTAAGGIYPAGGHIYTYYLKDINSSYTIDEEALSVIINLSISLSIPSGFVQFHIPGILSTDVDKYRFSSTYIQPVACNSINTLDGSISEDASRAAGGTIPMCITDSEGAVFSGKVIKQTSMTRSFIIRSGGDKYSFSKDRAIEAGHFYKFKALNDAMWTHTTGNYECVDLGLSVKWATWNLNASSPEEYGSLISWGELSGKPQYDLSEYKWYSNGDFTKYNTADTKMSLDAEDDAVYVRLGGKWRMPTKDEFEELRENCTITDETVNTIRGRRFTSKKNGYTDKSIFLPYAGRNQYQSTQYEGVLGFYWSSNRNTDIEPWSYDVYNNYVYSNIVRNTGISIRPVVDY